MKSVRRIYSFVFHDEDELDGRYSSSIVFAKGQFNKFDYLQSPLNDISNRMPSDLIEQREIQHITFSGKMNRLVAARLLQDYWQNPRKQGLTTAKVSVIQLQGYLAYSSK
jgi:hypothetical protein